MTSPIISWLIKRKVTDTAPRDPDQILKSRKEDA